MSDFSKSATRGGWNTVWSSFNNRQGAKAKAANEAGAGSGEVEGPGLFKAGGGVASMAA